MENAFHFLDKSFSSVPEHLIFMFDDHFLMFQNFANFRERLLELDSPLSILDAETFLLYDVKENSPNSLGVECIDIFKALSEVVITFAVGKSDLVGVCEAVARLS